MNKHEQSKLLGGVDEVYPPTNYVNNPMVFLIKNKKNKMHVNKHPKGIIDISFNQTR